MTHNLNKEQERIFKYLVACQEFHKDTETWEIKVYPRVSSYELSISLGEFADHLFKFIEIGLITRIKNRPSPISGKKAGEQVALTATGLELSSQLDTPYRDFAFDADGLGYAARYGYAKDML